MAPALAQTPKTLKISHQFPGGTIDEGDFRDRLCRKFAAEVEKRTNGQLKAEVYPNSALFKPEPQFTAMERGALDMSLFPLAYAGGKVPEVNITLMPALIESYEQAAKWKTSPIGKELETLLDQHGMKVLTWVWQAGGIASAGKPIVVPDDVKGTKIRGASKDMDLMLKAAGGAVTNMPSSEVYNAMQSKVLDAVVTSSASLMSFRLYENAKSVTTARDHSFWYMFEPLIISKATFNALTPEQQKIVTEVGTSLEAFAATEAKQDDKELADVFKKAGVEVHDMNAEQFAKWRELAKSSAWADYEKSVKNGKDLMQKATSVK